MATMTYISTRSTLMPHGSVASSKAAWNIKLQEQREKAEKITRDDVDKSKHLHIRGDALSVAEDLVQVFCSQDVSQSGLRQQSGMVYIFFVCSCFMPFIFIYIFQRELMTPKNLNSRNDVVKLFSCTSWNDEHFQRWPHSQWRWKPWVLFQFDESEFVFLIRRDLHL